MATSGNGSERQLFNLTHLITLSLIERYGSLTRVAEALGVTQPSISQQVRELEREAGLPVVQQRGRSVVLTALGKDLAAIGASVAIERERAARIAAQHCQGLAGMLTIAASMTTSAYVVPRAVAALQRSRPDARVELRAANTFDVAEMVKNDVADVGVIEGEVERAELLVTPFAKDRLICIAHARHALRDRVLRPQDASEETLLVREDGSGTRQAVLAALDAHAFRFAHILHFGTNEAIKAGVASGVGIAWVPEIMARSELGSVLSELRFETAPIVRSFSFVRRRDTQLTPLGDAFIEELRTLYT